MNEGAWWALYSPWGLKESDTTERLIPSLCSAGGNAEFSPFLEMRQ